jgi:hypothetical protein
VFQRQTLWPEFVALSDGTRSRVDQAALES